MPALNRIPAPPISPQILRCLFGVAGILIGLSSVSAQITAPRTASSTTDRFVRLEEQLVNRLRATAEDQRNYLHFVVQKVREGRLDWKLVVGIERYAMRRHASLPFLFFERALKYEAGKRGVTLPPVRQFATARVPDGFSR